MSVQVTPTTVTGAERVELLLTGFRSFSDINSARKAVAGIPGVKHLQARPGEQGQMWLIVTYQGIVPFEVHLNELRRERGHALPAHLALTA